MSEVTARQIHEASMRILSKVGVKFHHPDAVKILQDHGVRMEGNIAFFTEEQIMTWVKKAPSSFTLHAIDPNWNITIGGMDVANATCGGASKIMETDGTVRNARVADFVKILKLYEANDNYFINGGLVCQPEDLDARLATLILYYISLKHSRKVVWTACGDYQVMEAVMQMCMARYHLTKEQLMETPYLLEIVNTDTPLQLDKNMTESLLTYAKYKQPIAVSAASMAGTTSPITLAGTLAVSNAEIMATIALTEMYSPGTPVLYGSQTAVADMSTCSLAIGSPEGAIFYKYAAEMGRFYGIPSRAGGALTDAKRLNAQAGYESMMTYHACYQNGVNIVFQSSGIMDGYLAVSLEKLMVDFEIIDAVKRYERDVEVNEDTLAEDLIAEVGIGGNYLLEDHTVENFRDECMLPNISVRGPKPNPGTAFEENIQRRIQKMLDQYQQPEIDEDTLEAMRQVLRDIGLTDEFIAEIDKF